MDNEMQAAVERVVCSVRETKEDRKPIKNNYTKRI